MNKFIKRTVAFSLASLMMLSSSGITAFANSSLVNSDGSVNGDAGNITSNNSSTAYDSKPNGVTGYDDSQDRASEYKSIDGTEDQTSNVNVFTTQEESAEVVVPKTIILDGANTTAAGYQVQVSGNIAGDTEIKVVPESNETVVNSQGPEYTGSADAYFYMGSKGKQDVVAEVNQEKDTFVWDDVKDDATDVTTGTVESTISAGMWHGNFNFNVEFDASEVISWDISPKRDGSLTMKYISKSKTAIISGDATGLAIDWYENNNRTTSNKDVEIPPDRSIWGDYAREDGTENLPLALSPVLYLAGAPDDIYTYDINNLTEEQMQTVFSIVDLDRYLEGDYYIKDFKYPTETVIFESGMTEIPLDIMTGNRLLKNVVIPEGVKAIPVDSFYGCESLESITLPDSIEFIGATPFIHSGLTSISIPKNVEKIKNNVFRQTPIENITVDEENEHFVFADGALCQILTNNVGETYLNALKLTSSATDISEISSIDENALSFSSQSRINIRTEEVYIYGGNFEHMPYLEEVHIYSSASHIFCNFYESENLQKLVYEEGINSIELVGMNLTGNDFDIYIPGSLTHIRFDFEAYDGTIYCQTQDVADLVLAENNSLNVVVDATKF